MPHTRLLPYLLLIPLALIDFAAQGQPVLDSSERVPPLEKVPAALPGLSRVPLEQRFAALLARRDVLRPRIIDFDNRCRVYFSNSADAVECPKIKPQLIAEKAAYIKDASAFNWDLKQAIERATQWTGNWDEKEKELVNDALRGLKDGDLRNWLTANAQLNRFKDDTFSPLTANGSVLRFKDGFFLDDTTVANRENLIAFEAGKVFWNSMKDKRLEDGKTLETWFVSYASGHISVIGDMKAAKHRNEGFSGLGDIDTASQFGYVFRAQALQLNRPRGQSAQQEWGGVIREFQTRIDPLLRGK